MNTYPGSMSAQIYPGEFHPRLGIEEVTRELDSSCEAVYQPKTNIIEKDDSFLIEMEVPGVKREDFVVNIRENLISVTAIHKRPGANNCSFQLHELHNECFHRHIILPVPIDTGFASAEYHDGILTILLRKNGCHYCQSDVRVVVY